MSDWDRPNRHRLSVDVPSQLYMHLKASSESKNCSVTKWVNRAIIEKLKKEEGFRGKPGDN